MSYFEAHKAHKLECVALGDDTFPQFIIEMHFPVFNLIFKVHIPYAAFRRIYDFRERQIVSGDDADRTVTQQNFQQTLRPDSAVLAVGSLQQFVEKE